MRNITQLVGNAFGIAYDTFYVAVGMTINPVLNRAIGDKVKQFDRESPVDSAALKHRVGQQLRGYMMGSHNDVFGLALGNCILQKAEATLMFLIESGEVQALSTCHDAVKVGNGFLGQVCVINLNLRP